MNDIPFEAQRALCARYGVPGIAAPAELKIGVARNVRTNLKPLNGLRHPPQADTTGWIWAGEEFSTSPDYFEPLHVAHLVEWCPLALKFLGLPPRMAIPRRRRLR